MSFSLVDFSLVVEVVSGFVSVSSLIIISFSVRSELISISSGDLINSALLQAVSSRMLLVMMNDLVI